MHRMANIQVQFTLIEFLNLHHGKMQLQMIEVSQKPLRTARISPDGNCFFHCIAMIITGSQEYHEEMRLLMII